MSRLFASLYFSVQRSRGGVTRPMIDEAAALLAKPWADIETHVRSRLAALYGRVAYSPDWLPAQPLTERTTLVPEVQRLQATVQRSKVEVRKTSGSTGTPFGFLKDREMTARMDAAMWAVYRWHGIEPGQPHARFWGMPPAGIARIKKRASDRMLNRKRLSAFAIDEQRSRRFYSALRRFRPGYAYGYPTLMSEFASHCTRAGLDGSALGFQVVVSTGELLTPVVREQLRGFFGCPVINEYGCTESGVLAFECEHSRLHTIPVAATTEVVDSAGTPVGAGEIGELVLTDLYGHTMPLLRYRLHDQVRAPTLSDCRCGRSLPTYDVIAGRIDNFIETPTRGRVYDAILAYTVPPGVLRFRAMQTASDRLSAQVVAVPGFDPVSTAESCRRRWEEELGPGLQVEVTAVPELPYMASGKLRYFVPLSALAESPEATT